MTADRPLFRRGPAVVALVLGALLLVLLADAVERGLADVHARHVRYDLETWAKRGQVVSHAEWRDALGAAEAHIRLLPGDPDALENLGRIYSWATFGKPHHKILLAYHQQALVFFRQAVQRRPVSGYTWANIAQEKLALDAIDAEFAHALDRAALLGPWEPEVQLAVADAGLAAWRKLPDSSREVVRDTVVRATRRQSAGLTQIARQRGAQTLCEIPGARRAVQALACR